MCLPGLTALAVLIVAQSLSVPNLAIPDFRDLTIKTRRTYGEMSAAVITEILLLRGARERREQIYQRPGLGEADQTIITINQCDKRQVVHLNSKTKLYGAAPFEDWPGHIKRLRPIAQPEQAGADVEITIDSVDTGERQQVGSYIARRVTMTRKVEPSPGANTRASTDDSDGWYIDLPRLGCSNSRTDASFLMGEVVSPGRPHDQLHFRQLGSAPRGYAIRETTRHTEEGRTSVAQVELLEFSEAPLDAVLFNVPSGYQAALPRVHGGHDLTQPDTLVNRLHTYWDELVLWAARVREQTLW